MAVKAHIGTIAYRLIFHKQAYHDDSEVPDLL